MSGRIRQGTPTYWDKWATPTRPEALAPALAGDWLELATVQKEGRKAKCHTPQGMSGSTPLSVIGSCESRPNTIGCPCLAMLGLYREGGEDAIEEERAWETAQVSPPAGAGRWSTGHTFQLSIPLWDHFISYLPWVSQGCGLGLRKESLADKNGSIKACPLAFLLQELIDSTAILFE